MENTNTPPVDRNDKAALMAEIDKQMAWEHEEALKFMQKPPETRPDPLTTTETKLDDITIDPPNLHVSERQIEGIKNTSSDNNAQNKTISRESAYIVSIRIKHPDDIRQVKELKSKFNLSDIVRQALRDKYRAEFPELPAYARIQIERAQEKQRKEQEQAEIDAMSPEEYHKRFLEPDRYFSEIKEKENTVEFHRWRSGLGATRVVPLNRIKEYTENPFKNLIDDNYKLFYNN